MNSWKPFIKRLGIYLILLYGLIPLGIKWRGTTPQISVNALYGPIVFAGLLTAFIILKREELKTFDYKLSWKQAIIFGLLAYSAFAGYLIVQNTYFGMEYNIQALMLGWTLYLLGGLLLFTAVFNTNFVKHFLKSILLTFAVIIVYGGTSILLNLSGQPIANWLAKILAPLLALTNNVTIDVQPGSDPLLRADSFSAIIGSPCTGITSLILFTGLFLFIVILDWQKINKKTALWIYPVGAIGILIVAFLRLYLLYLIGANWSPKFALAAFHTNAGWILFVLYFLAYFYFTYPLLTKKP